MRTRRLLGVMAAITAAACSSPQVITTSTPTPVLTPSTATTDLTKPPILGAPPTLAIPSIITRQLPNGLKIVVVEQHELPLVDMLLEVRSGGEAQFHR